MRYIVMHKIGPSEDASAPPPPRILQEMGALVQGSVASGVFKNGAGLRPVETRVRVAVHGGKTAVERGPYVGDQELCSRIAMVRTPGLEEAIALVGRYAEALGDLDVEIGPVVEPWDLGMIPRPASMPTSRFLLLLKSTPADEAGEQLSPEAARAVAKLEAELGQEGILLANESLTPTGRAIRMPMGEKGKRRWVDGPFSESKELVGGFSLIEVPTNEDALAWATRYAEILDENEVDLRELG